MMSVDEYMTGEQMELYEEIAHLISMHQEGPYWDFKREWYGKEHDVDKLIDIICMANNLEDRDAYIIIGIDEENGYSMCDIRKDPNRSNTQKLTNFLRDKKFAGDYRPTVTVEALVYGEKAVDVIVVHNSLNVPFYLKEPYVGKISKNKSVEAGNIYVRLQDSNTPRNAIADFHQVEYLWKKRFGMLLAPLEKVMLYLRHPEDWENSPSDDDKRYYKYAPEYTIVNSYEEEDDCERYFYFMLNQWNTSTHWHNIRIYYHQTVLADIGGVVLDGGRYFTPVPHPNGINVYKPHGWDITYSYMVEGTIEHIVHEFYYDANRDIEAQDSHDRFEECILIFRDENEQAQFHEYVKERWDASKDELGKDIYVPDKKEIPANVRDSLRKTYKEAAILQRLLFEYRYGGNEQERDDSQESPD